MTVRRRVPICAMARRPFGSRLGRRQLRVGRLRHADRAVDVAGSELVALLQAAVEDVEGEAGAVAGAGGAAERHLIAAGDGLDAESLLDEREVLVELAEQHGGEAVVVEGDDDLGGAIGRRWRPAPSVLCAPRDSSASGLGGIDSIAAAQANAPNRLLVPTSVMVTGTISPISSAGASTWTGISQGERPTSLAGLAAGLLEQNIDRHGRPAGVKLGLLAGDHSLQAMQAFGFHGSVT